MIAALLMALMGLAHGQTCGAVQSIPESLQVAWVSPVGARVGMNGWVEAVRVAEMRHMEALAEEYVAAQHAPPWQPGLGETVLCCYRRGFCWGL